MCKISIHAFIESDLTRKLGGQTQHLRKDHFEVKQIKKSGHSKNKCPRGRHTKKVNNTHRDVSEDSGSNEETDEETEKESLSDDDEDEEDSESQNCFSIKKKKDSQTWSSCSDSSVISENVAKHLGLKIDRNNVYALNGVTGKTKTLGTVNVIPITIGEGENSATIPDEFSVVPAEKDWDGKDKSLLILGTQ
ncbi:hypothetical protein C1646_776972 [Rhizophagus diaphanus]|nr:hypothetical protein C1646_776972 [Rhizophagus diaphanus] [Rhizophagus sp. MUCL 43196]